MINLDIVVLEIILNAHVLLNIEKNSLQNMLSHTCKTGYTGVNYMLRVMS